MKIHIKKAIIFSTLVVFLFQLAACGTLLYPERRGRHSGEIDVKIAVLDGLGLLFGIIPGVVAYIVDFSTGAIYLPSGKRNFVLSGDMDITVIHVPPMLLQDPEKVKEIVSREMALPSIVNWDRLETSSIRMDQVKTRFAEVKAAGYATFPTSGGQTSVN